MRQLIRRLQKAAEFSRMGPLQSPLLVRDGDAAYPSSGELERRKKKVVNRSGWRSEESDGFEVPEGFLPVYVGQDSTRFIINARFLNHPIFVELLQISAQEYGYEQQGVLRIPCDVMLFEHIVYLLNRNGDSLPRNLRLEDMERSVFC